MPYMLSGKILKFSDPRPEDVALEDIAHNLSMITRYNGSCPKHYSVAEHSIIVSQLVGAACIDAGIDSYKTAALTQAALLHDAHEAYTGDVITPLKELMLDGVFRELCRRIDGAIEKKLLADCPATFYASEIEYVDTVLLDAEIRTFFPGRVSEKKGYVPPLAEVLNYYASYIEFLSQERAKRAFLDRAQELGIKEV